MCFSSIENEISDYLLNVVSFNCIVIFIGKHDMPLTAFTSNAYSPVYDDDNVNNNLYCTFIFFNGERYKL